jgi:hypothetical protein
MLWNLQRTLAAALILTGCVSSPPHLAHPLRLASLATLEVGPPVPDRAAWDEDGCHGWLACLDAFHEAHPYIAEGLAYLGVVALVGGTARLTLLNHGHGYQTPLNGTCTAGPNCPPPTSYGACPLTQPGVVIHFANDGC